ncbi:MAG: squalene synthase HpnC [Betaproteobacteria bacterium]|nr:squalene synthase HpnC [Betaproteobacteria bacterium]
MPVDHYENFPVASFLLPAHLRRPIELIYQFARRADDFADEGDRKPAERLALLEGFESQLDAIESGDMPADSLFAGLQQIILHHALPVSLFRDLLDAFKQDVTKVRYANDAELFDYCRRSANPIGRLLLHLYRETAPHCLAHSDAICTALQLINHWQDVAIDWKKNGFGRVYLPRDLLEKHGLSDSDIEHQRVTPAWSAMMAERSAQARALMMSGRPLGRILHGRIGAELRLIMAGGLAILDKIDAAEGDVFRHRPVLTRVDWLRLAPRALLAR